MVIFVLTIKVLSDVFCLKLKSFLLFHFFVVDLNFNFFFQIRCKLIMLMGIAVQKQLMYTIFIFYPSKKHIL